MKPSLCLATGNAGKIAELSLLLESRFECLSPKSSRFVALSYPEVVEDADTYYENGLKKAIAYHRIYKIAVLADDSGLEVDALDGRPGVHTASFADGLSWPQKWERLVESLKHSGRAQPWTARFRCVLAMYDGVRAPQFFEGLSEGEIVPVPVGGKGFGYDPIFFSYPLKKTFAEASADEKSRVGHRGLAARALLAAYSSLASTASLDRQKAD